MKRFFCKLLTYVACFFMTNYSFFSFFENSFFPFNLFLQQHKNLTKSNNKKNSHMNQLLKLPLLKYTHTHIYIYIHILKKKITIIKRKTIPPSLPKKKRTPTTSQTEVPTATVKEQEPSTVAAKISTPDVVAILDFLHFYVSAT